MGKLEKESQRRTTGSKNEGKENLTITSGPFRIDSDIDKPIITWLDNKLNGKKK